MNTERFSILKPALQCACGNDLRFDELFVYCDKCGLKNAIGSEPLSFVNNSFVCDEKKDLIYFLKDTLRKIPVLYFFIMRIFGTSMLNLTAKKFFKQHYRPGDIALNIGSGTHTIDPHVFNVDLFPYKRVDVTADICSLPFKSNSVDLIICEEVLEHLPDPDSALREMSRILKNTGRIYMNVPFIMQYHSSPHDYQRWTKYGVRQMMSKHFTVTNLGVAYGPTSALVLVLVSWIAIVLSCGSQKIYNASFITFQIILAPWCHLLDQILGRFETAENMNCGFYCEGEKLKGA